MNKQNYVLITDSNYPDKFYIISDNLNDLEEIALSIFEEDWYKIFSILQMEEKHYIVPIESIKAKSFKITLKYMCNYSIKSIN